MELNLNKIKKEKNGNIKIISWVYTVQDKDKQNFFHCGTTSGLWHKPEDNCIHFKPKNKKNFTFDLSIYKQEVSH